MKRSVIILGALLISCAAEKPPVTLESAGVPQRVVVAPQQLREAPPVFNYQPAGKKDPFRPFFHDDGDHRPRSNEPLAQFEIEQLRLTAVLVGTATPTALIEDPTGLGHLVRVGTIVGRDGAQVKHIRRGQIVLEQVITNQNLTRSIMLVPMTLTDPT